MLRTRRIIKNNNFTYFFSCGSKFLTSSSQNKISKPIVYEPIEVGVGIHDIVLWHDVYTLVRSVTCQSGRILVIIVQFIPFACQDSRCFLYAVVDTVSVRNHLSFPTATGILGTCWRFVPCHLLPGFSCNPFDYCSWVQELVNWKLC